MADLLYNSGKAALLGDTTHTDGTQIDLLGDNIYVALVTSTYVPDADAHHTYNDITNEVANGNGYTTGGAALASKTAVIDDTGNQGDFDAADLTWSASTITARGAVLYRNVGTATQKVLLAYFDFGSDQSSSSGDFTIAWNAGGILTLS